MRENDFTINMKNLENGPVTLQVDCAPEALDLEDPKMEFSRVKGEVEFSLVSPRVVARGILETEAATECVRCLTDAKLLVRAHVNAIYENEKLIRETRGEMVSPEEQIVTTFNGDWIQPENELRESIMLELPMLPLCRSDCKGLCDKCGANLNEGRCDCDDHKDQDVSPWKQALEGLEGLKLE